MKTNYTFLLPVLVLVTMFSACDKPLPDPLDLADNDFELTGATKYIIAATPVGTSGIADYLLTAADLDQGKITTRGNGMEQEGSYRYYVSNKNRFFSLLYGQGNPGAVTSYKLDATGKLSKLTNFQTETMQVLAPAKDDIFTIKVPRSGNEFATMFRINARKYQIVGEQQANIVKLAGNGERAHFTCAVQTGDKIFIPYMSIKGEPRGGDTFGTKYPDSTWVAVYSYPELRFEKTIRDNRTSFIGNYFVNGMTVTDEGDIYAFSPAAATNNGKAVSTKPSAIVRINKGTTEFDRSYFFNVQQAAGGHHISGQTYVGKGLFILEMYPQPNSLDGEGKKFAVADVVNKTFKWVTGVPDNITSTTPNNYSPKDGKKAYIGITTASEGSYVYVFDAEIAVAKKGLQVEGGTITAINALNY
ncbi:DUF4374 domain-containing protein [Pedobacter caeni]|uniref:DUF4374 domain-containing protein n=1 Tax=Pedobacter caeni TaxID=288992 RepID=A0A1M5BCV9_9SPHI|nr:DUF4374 domain-containing protein [Pedobacter caeni]SHF40270.1 protein of unknown function [Pedobacter caeni]